jgi:hypothetical protein
MPTIPKFFNGRLNLDDSLFLVEKGDFVDALNITRDQVAGQHDIAISNIRSNRLVENELLPAERNKVIGIKEDPVRNVAYLLVWNEPGLHSVFRYNNATRTFELIIQDTFTPPFILDFQENKKIIHIDIVHRDEGDIISWVDANTAPKAFNVETALAGGLQPLSEFVEAAKRPPKFVPFGVYVSDANVKTNNMKGKLFEFAYRYVYGDFQKSTFSYLSASPLPANDYIANLNPLSNNGINVDVNTGSANVKKVEVAMRYSIGNQYSDYYLINVIDKDALGLSNNTDYVFNFYNNAVYPAIDPNESGQLFDYVPRRANAQCMPNGNYMVYGGILEGYDKLTQDELDVIMSVTYENIVIPAGTVVIGNPTFTYVQNSAQTFTVTVGSTVTAGDEYTIRGTNNVPAVDFTFSYTALLGDTPNDVAAYFVSQIDPLFNVSATNNGGGVFTVQYSIALNATLDTEALAATASGTGGFYDRIYGAAAKYRYGMVYFDEQGRTNGVMTYVLESGSQNDFEVETENFSATSTEYTRPIISITVQHLPPQWARSFSFVRTENLITTSFFMWKIDDFQQVGSFYYFGIDNLEAYQADNPNWTAAWTFQAGDRIKPLYQFSANDTGFGTQYSPVLDFEVIGVVEYDPGSGAQTYIKTLSYAGTITPNYDDNVVFMVYRPAQKTTESQQVYFEFGETYETVEIDGVWYHLGQTAFVNPTWNFRDGDSYIRIRPGTGDEYLILDPNFSEYEPSALDSNGRAFIVDENAAETYNPTLVRFSEAYQSGTNINGLNRFYPENFDEYDKAYGDIMKLDTYASYMKVGQKLRIGNVPVFLQMVNDQQQNSLLATSSRLINQIVYYTGDFGVGNTPESWARNNFAVYFASDIRGAVCRLSQDGITPISMLYKINSFCTEKLPLRSGNSKVYGVFNASVNRYEFAMEAAGSDPAYTMVFDEPTNSFEGRRSYEPEMMGCLGTLLITCKDGNLYTHDDSSYNNFYGQQYESFITAVFNENTFNKKTFISLTEQSNIIWDCPEIYTNIDSIRQLSLKQESNLITQDFTEVEGQWSASFLTDMNSVNGIVNGDSLKGSYVVIKFRAQASQTTELVFLALSSVYYIDSPLNLR